MRMSDRNRHGRPAFTLIEMLVVIAIIGTLISLLMVAIWPVVIRANQTQCFHEITHLNNAAQTWKTTYKVTFAPPSQLFLSNNYNDYANNPAGPQSLRYLNLIWPRLGSFWNSTTPTPAGFDWSGGLGMPQGGVLLQGDQCLVFFLGGIPTKDNNGNFGVMGFSTNPQNPTQLTGDHIPPQFEFQSGRLYQRLVSSGNPFLSYQDTWGTKQPYIFFSSGMKRNGYNPGETTLGVTPYYSGVANGVTNFLNPNNWQIISAGRDGQFGTGGLWNPPTVPTPAEADDQSNFSDSLLGVGL